MRKPHFIGFFPGAAFQQPLGSSGVVGRQDDEAGVLLGQGEDLPGAVGELAAAPHPRDLATLEDLGSVGEVPGQQQWRHAGPPDQE
jgi:hypothetical protein